jgi:hypothetical protein
MNFSHEKNPGKNLTGIAIVIVLHLIVAYGIINGLGKRMVTKMAEAVETKIDRRRETAATTGDAAPAAAAGNEGPAASVHPAGRSAGAAAAAAAECDR